jgi:plastocyanin
MEEMIQETAVKNNLWLIVMAVGLAGATTSKPLSAFATSANSQAATEMVVKIDNFSFSPATLTVPVGTTVRWTNLDDIPHSIVSDDKIFKSQALDTNDQFTYTFTKPGTYGYFCGLHPKMTAKVVVQ